jgi:hypothetical protein
MTLLHSFADFISDYTLPLPLYYIFAIILAPFRFISDVYYLLFVHPNLKSPPNTVYVNGLLGFGNNIPILKYWGILDKSIITPQNGPVSSSYDGAVELFYNLIGVGIDSQIKKVSAPINIHSSLHSNILVNNVGLVPNWDENHPLTFVCHSKGCSIFARLLLLLEQNAFPGHQTSSKWVKSIVLISPGLPGIDYLDNAGRDKVNLTITKNSKLYYFLAVQYYSSFLLPSFVKNLFDIRNPVYKSFDAFLHDNAYITPEYKEFSINLPIIKKIIKSNKIPINLYHIKTKYITWLNPYVILFYIIFNI